MYNFFLYTIIIFIYIFSEVGEGGGLCFHLHIHFITQLRYQL